MNDKSMYEQTVEQLIGQMNQCISEGRKKILEPKSFEMYLGGFMQLVSNGVPFFSTPAVIFTDTEDNKHAIVGGEKWKLITFALIHINHQDITFNVVFTNPLTMDVDQASTNAAKCLEALAKYDIVYNFCIKNIMSLNEEMIAIQETQSNGDRITHMSKVVELLEDIAREVSVYYGIRTDVKLN